MTDTVHPRTLLIPARSRRKRRSGWTLAAMIVLLVVMLFPVYWMLMTAILPTSSVLSRNPSIIPIGEPISLDAFAALFSDSPILRWLSQSGIVTIGAAVLSTAISLFAAYAMSRFVIPGRKMIAFTFLMGRVLPGTLLALPFFVLFQVAGLLDTPFAVILANTAAITPLTALILKGYLDGIPKEIDEAAMVDGCSRLGVLRRVILPISGPGLAACIGIAATSAWTDLLFSKTLLLSTQNGTLPQGIASMIGDAQVNWNELMAAGLVSIVPVLIVYWFLQPYLVSGMTAGGVKG